MRLGARILKTGLAVTLAMYASIWFGFETPTVAGMAAFFAVQPSVHKSFSLIGDQIQANVISAILSIVFVLAFGKQPVVIGAVVMLIIALHIKFKKEAILSLAVVTAVIIMGTPADNFVQVAINRFLLVMLGVVAAFIVNLIFLPPKHENTLYHRITDTNDKIVQWIRLITRHEAEYTMLNQDLKQIDDSILKIDNTFQLFKDERHFLNKNEYFRLRKVVLFRQMIQTTKKAKEILNSLSKHENQLYNLPEELQELIKEQLDKLTNFHERLLLKYTGKVKTNNDNETEMKMDIGKRQLTQLFLSRHEKPDVNRDEWIHFFPIIAVIIEYGEELERLNKLINTFFKFHKSKSEIEVSEREY